MENNKKMFLFVNFVQIAVIFFVIFNFFSGFMYLSPLFTSISTVITLIVWINMYAKNSRLNTFFSTKSYKVSIYIAYLIIAFLLFYEANIFLVYFALIVLIGIEWVFRSKKKNRNVSDS
ncbi:hypothetical protein [Jeotgalibacillus campisalis]|uniref:hypothetical protein n=1 Tax=Jeotgalibacillus campisalis TaxID=220754 RepID=UPI000596D519|nr:hypothetical protein [Jeotgalibacillus campisalis]